MLLPPPRNNSDKDKDKVSEKVLPPTTLSANPGPLGSQYDDSLPANVPQGDELVTHVLNCLDQGSSREEIRKQLIAFGYSSRDAYDVVDSVAEWRKNNLAGQAAFENASNSGSRDMMIGGAICLIGLLVTIGTCMAASEGGGRYVVAWGAIVFGAIQFFRGMTQSNQS